MGGIVDAVFGGGDDAAEASAAAAATTAQAQKEGAQTAADAALRGSEIAAESQQKSLDYLKEREAIPRQFSEQALKGLGGIYGMEGGTGSQQDLINQAIQSPLYQSIIAGRGAGEDAILRNASATGGLRSGNVQEALYDYNTQLKNKALLESYNQQLAGLSGMAGLPSNANQIAGSIAGIGQTLGQGQTSAGQIYGQGQVNYGSTIGQGMVAGAQAQQAGQQNNMNNLLGIAGLGVSMFSDRRLKKNLKKITEVNGHNWYTWDWNAVAQKMGLKGKSEGVLADEIFDSNPDCITFIDCFLAVDYTKLGIFPMEVANA